MRNHFLMKA